MRRDPPSVLPAPRKAAPLRGLDIDRGPPARVIAPVGVVEGSIGPVDSALEASAVSDLPRRAGRFAFIDGLRGIAAVSVVLFHLGRDYLDIGILKYGYHGVTVFFVISGFVICHALASSKVSGAFFWRFLLRRSVRLDPPYWTSIAIAVLIANVPLTLLGAQTNWPSFGTVVAHLFYLQDLVDVQPINVVYWTLCYEFQFYIVFALLLCAMGAVSKSIATSGIGVEAHLFSVLLPISLVWPLGLATAPGGLFINLWYLFLLGAIARWSMTSKVALASLLLASAILALSWASGTVDDRVLIGVLTALAIRAAAALGTLGKWLRHPWIQYLGAISYSLYLLHDIVGAQVRGMGLHLTRTYAGMHGYAVDATWVVLAIAASLAAAHLMHRWVERPSLDFSRRISMSRGGRRNDG